MHITSMPKGLPTLELILSETYCYKETNEEKNNLPMYVKVVSRTDYFSGYSCQQQSLERKNEVTAQKNVRR